MEMGYRVLKVLFEHGIRVTFLTKGVIPKKHMELCAEFAPLVFAEIGLISVDDAMLRLFEPAAARAAQRLKQIAQLVHHKIRTEVRVDPIIPGFTDDESSLRALFAAIASSGVQDVAASALFLRPAIAGSLRKHLNSSQFARLMGAVSKVGRMDIHAENSSVQALPAEIRRGIYTRVQSIAAEFGITVKICACKNPDLAKSSCGIAGNWQSRTGVSLPVLFP
jgi:DNA repair photolyase